MPFDTPMRADVNGYRSDELIAGGAVQQGDRKVKALAEDLVAAGTPPPNRNEKLVVRGKELNIESVDDSTCRDGPGLIAYILQVRG